MWYIKVCIKQIKLQQNLICMRPNRSWIIKHSTLPNSANSETKFLQLNFCFCSYTWAAQLISVVFHLDISFISCFRVIFCAFWSFIAEGVDGVEDRGGSGDTKFGVLTLSWRPFWTCPWDLHVSLIKFFFSGKKHNLWYWDYQDFWIIRHQVKGNMP